MRQLNPGICAAFWAAGQQGGGGCPACLWADVFLRVLHFAMQLTREEKEVRRKQEEKEAKERAKAKAVLERGRLRKEKE